MSQKEAYTAGTLITILPIPCADPEACWESNHRHYDSPINAIPKGPNDSIPPVCFLPHSCDEWIIGGPDEIRALIVDLNAALALMCPSSPAKETNRE